MTLEATAILRNRALAIAGTVADHIVAAAAAGAAADTISKVTGKYFAETGSELLAALGDADAVLEIIGECRDVITRRLRLAALLAGEAKGRA